MKKLEDLLSASQYCVLATVDTEGNPWSAPVFFVSDDKRSLYWWSDTQAQHSRNIEANGRLYVTIFDSNLAEGQGEGLYMRCTASVVAAADMERVSSLYNSHTKTFKIGREDVTGEAPTRLYQAQPQEVWHNAEGSRNGMYIDIREEIA